MGKTLGRRIRRARLQNGWSQALLAEKVGVAQPTISSWEQGKTKPDEKQMKHLEHRLGSLRSTPGDSSPGTKASPDEGPAPFGAWLYKSRLKRGLSVAELAELSKVSIPAIYAIEKGSIENPRRETIQKLEKALGEQRPDDLQEEMEDETRIEGLGAFTDFDPHDKEDLPSAPGVYVLYDVSERPIYVGTSKDIAKRIKQHYDKFWFKDPIVATGSFVEIKDEQLRQQVELLLIKFLKSNAVLNKQNVEQ